MKKKIFSFVILCFSISILSTPQYSTIKPTNELKITEDIPYKSNFFYIPEKKYFVFGRRTSGFSVYDSNGKLIKKYNPPSQSPGFLMDLEQFFITEKFYYAVGLFNIVKLDKNFNFVEDITKGNAGGGSVCWINNKENFYCATSTYGLEYLNRKGIVIKQNTDIIIKKRQKTISRYFSRLKFYVDYPSIYFICDGGLQFYKLNLKTLKTIYKRQLPIPKDFKSAFKEDKKVNLGFSMERFLKEAKGYGRVWTIYISGDYLFVAWKKTALPDGFVDIYSISKNKILYHLKLEDTEETIFHRMTFNPKKPVLYDYDYIEVEDGNDYGLIRAYDLTKFLKN